jgi:c-di-GMP-binding flagellar brake protein YcgR
VFEGRKGEARMDERRLHRRKTIEIDVEAHISAQQKWVGVRSRNISRGGMCLITSTMIPLNTELDIVFYINEFDKLLRVRGTVVWNECDLDSGRYLHGVKFDPLSDSANDVISKYVESTTFNVG